MRRSTSTTRNPATTSSCKGSTRTSLKAEFKTTKFKQTFIMVFAVEYCRTQLLRAAGFQRKVPPIMIAAKAREAPSTKPLIEVFLEEYHVTDDPEDFIPDDVIKMDFSASQNINIPAIRTVLDEYKEKKNLVHLNAYKQKRVNGRVTRGIAGIITMDEHEKRTPCEDEATPMDEYTKRTPDEEETTHPEAAHPSGLPPAKRIKL